MSTARVATLTLALTGQALIERDLRSVRHSGLDRVIDVLRHADLTFTNLESAVAGRHGGVCDPGRLNHVGPPAILDTLKEWGFDTVALASNHSYDLGPEGIRSALEEATARGLLHAGSGLDARAASTPGVATRAGVPVALVAMTAARRPPEAAATDGTGDRPGKPGVNPLRVRKSGVDPIDSERNLATIAHAVAEGRFVLAYIHQHYWAEDWHDVPDWLTPFARDCVTAGAAAVVVHGVPLLQGIEIFRERPILYGLGNFVFHTHQPHKYPGSEAWEGLVVTARFDTTPALTELKLQPIVFGQHPALSTDDQALQAPLIARPDTAEQILQRVSRASSSFPLGVRIDTRSGTATWGEGVNG